MFNQVHRMCSAQLEGQPIWICYKKFPPKKKKNLSQPEANNLAN